MHSTQRELLDAFVSFVGDAADDTSRSIAAGCLSRALTQLWIKHPWRIFRSPAAWQLTLAADQAQYALPDYFGRVGPGEVRNLTQAGRPLPRLQDGELERAFPLTGTDDEIAGEPKRYEIAGTCGVHTQPDVTGEVLEVLSNDADDVDVEVAIAGDDAYGRWTRALVTLMGSTPVSLGTWSYVDELGKAYADAAIAETPNTSSRGTITVRKTSDTTELQTLFRHESAKAHDVLTLYPKPDAAYVLAFPVIRKPKRLIAGADAIPDLWTPALWEEMLVQWGMSGGDLTIAAAGAVPRPNFIELVQLENQQKGRAMKRPFGRF